VGGLKASPKVIKEASVETIHSLGSPDRPTRHMSRWFLFFLFCAFLVILKAAHVGYQSHLVGKVEKQRLMEIANEKKAQEELEKKKLSPPPYISMGTFSLELREKPGMLKPKNSLNSAEMEMVITCDEAELCEWIQENLPLARAELGPLFVPMERDRLLTTQGKRAFREEIRDQLNRFIEKKGKKGMILEVLFPRFIMSMRKRPDEVRGFYVASAYQTPCFGRRREV
jgi:flagellar basal body-associated protein FliL